MKEGLLNGAGERIRTVDIDLGKVVENVNKKVTEAKKSCFG